MKFVLYGRYDLRTYVDAFMATNCLGLDFSFEEIDCDSVLIAFNNGIEVDRTYDMDKLSYWVRSLTTSEYYPPSHKYTGGAMQSPLPGLETPPCR